MLFPLGNSAWALVKDKTMYNVRLSKQNHPLEKVSSPHGTRNSNAPSITLRTGMLEVQIQSLRPLKAGVQLINTKKSEWYSTTEKETSGLSLL